VWAVFRSHVLAHRHQHDATHAPVRDPLRDNPAMTKSEITEHGDGVRWSFGQRATPFRWPYLFGSWSSAAVMVVVVACRTPILLSSSRCRAVAPDTASEGTSTR